MSMLLNLPCTSPLQAAGTSYSAPKTPNGAPSAASVVHRPPDESLGDRPGKGLWVSHLPALFGATCCMLLDHLVTVVDVSWHGSSVVELTYKGAAGRLGSEFLHHYKEATL